MRAWLRRQDWYWTIYHEWGITFGPRPVDREWNILVTDEVEIPPPQPGFTQRVVRIPRPFIDAIEAQARRRYEDF